MTKLETLYQSIEGLKALGLPLNEETLKAVDNLEEDLIKNEVIPRLSDSIEPIITQIQRPIVLVVDYVPGENLSVRLTRKRIIIEEPDTKQYSIVPKEIKPSKKTDKTLTSAPKSAWTGLKVTMPNGKVINNRFAYETLIEVVEFAGVKKIEALKMKQVGIDFISKTKDDFYNQHEITGGYYIVTHSSTLKKKQQIEEISKRLSLGLKVEIV
jgi:hypothetical protein